MSHSHFSDSCEPNPPNPLLSLHVSSHEVQPLKLRCVLTLLMQWKGFIVYFTETFCNVYAIMLSVFFFYSVLFLPCPLPTYDRYHTSIILYLTCSFHTFFHARGILRLTVLNNMPKCHILYVM